jgi:hypothetical protein
MRWAGHMLCIEDRKSAYWIWWEVLRVREYLETGLNGRIILNWVFKR